MKSTGALLLGSFLAISATIHAQEKGWRGLVPLHSTREDVEEVIGPSIDKSPVLYKLEDVIVVIDYASDNGCGTDRASGWKVPRDTVITIAAHFRTRVDFADLKIDTTKYKKIVDPEIPGTFFYVNTEQGINIQVSGNSVEGISYFPADKENYLRCPPRSVRPPSN